GQQSGTDATHGGQPASGTDGAALQPPQGPPPQISPASVEPNTASAAANEYTVQKGDSLWQIAAQQLGDGSKWQEIYNLNQSAIGNNPNDIQIGTQLKIPGGA